VQLRTVVRSVDFLWSSKTESHRKDWGNCAQKWGREYPVKHFWTGYSVRNLPNDFAFTRSWR